MMPRNRARLLDEAIERLLRGEPVDDVLVMTNPTVRPYAAIFAALRCDEPAVEPATADFRLALRERFVIKGMASRRPEPVTSGRLHRAAVAAIASLVLGSAINPALASELVDQIRVTFGQPVADLVRASLNSSDELLEASTLGTNAEVTRQPGEASALRPPRVMLEGVPATTIPSNVPETPNTDTTVATGDTTALALPALDDASLAAVPTGGPGEAIAAPRAQTPAIGEPPFPPSSIRLDAPQEKPDVVLAPPQKAPVPVVSTDPAPAGGLVENIPTQPPAPAAPPSESPAPGPGGAPATGAPGNSSAGGTDTTSSGDRPGAHEGSTATPAESGPPGLEHATSNGRGDDLPVQANGGNRYAALARAAEPGIGPGIDNHAAVPPGALRSAEVSAAGGHAATTGTQQVFPLAEPGDQGAAAEPTGNTGQDAAAPSHGTRSANATDPVAPWRRGSHATDAATR